MNLFSDALRLKSKEVYELALEKGWYETRRHPLEIHMLIVSEIAEATECVRRGESCWWYNSNGKPEGEAIELADAVIRIMDYFEDRGWDLGKAINAKHEFNKTRPYKHGKKC